VGDIFGPVVRPEEIEIEAVNENGEKFRLRADGILARVIQHEMDHLNGIEFLEKVSDYSKIISKKFYRKNIRSSKEQLSSSQVTKIIYTLI
jgi:peptide deformylase